MAAALSLLKRNLPQPFSLTLLNIGATGFAAQQQPGGAMPPVFARLLSRGEAAAAPPAGVLQCVSSVKVDLWSSLKELSDMPFSVQVLRLRTAATGRLLRQP